MNERKVFKKTVLAIMLAAVTLTSYSSKSGPGIQDITDSNYFANRKIENGKDGNFFSQVLWEEQDSIERDILNGISDTSIGLDIYEKDFDEDKFKFQLGVDIKPKKRVYRVNKGLVKEGVPDENTESYYMVVDAVRTKLDIATRYADILTDSGIRVGATPLSWEISETIRKTSIVRDPEEYEKVTADVRNNIDALRSSDKKPETGKLGKVRVKAAAKAVFDYVALGFKYLGDFAKYIYEYFVDSEVGNIQKEDFFGGVDLKKRLFYINDQTLIKNLGYGETLNLIHQKQFGFAGGWISKGVASITGSPIHRRIKERTLERVRVEECKNPFASGNQNACAEVLLTLRSTVEFGFEYDPLRLIQGVGPVDIKYLTSRGNKGWFRDIEWIYRIDLNTVDGVTAFNAIFDEFDPKWDTFDNIEKANKGMALAGKPGVTLLSKAWRGRDNNDKKDKRNGSYNRFNGRINVEVYRRQHRSDTTMYPSCVTKVVDSVEQTPECFFDGISIESRKVKNDLKARIQWSLKDFWRFFIKKIEFYRDQESTLTGLEIRAKGDPTTVGKAANLHFFTDYRDKNTEFAKYRKKFVENTAMLLAIGQVPELYEQGKAKAISDRITQLRNEGRRGQVEKSVQTLSANLYLTEDYISTVLDHTEDDVRAEVANMITGQRSWDFLMKADCSQFRPPYDVNMGRTCEGKRSLAKKLVGMFKEFQTLSAEKKIRKLIKLYVDKDKPPYIAYLLMVLGRNHKELIGNDDLNIPGDEVANKDSRFAIRLISEASDLAVEDKFADLYTGDWETLGKEVYVPRPGIGDPNKGAAHIANANYKYDKTDDPNDPRLLLEFDSDIKHSYNGNALDLSGHMAEFEFAKDKYATKFKALGIKHFKKIDANLYRYVIDFGPLSAIKLADKKGNIMNLERDGKAYIIQFRLEDPVLDFFLPSKRLSETREIRFVTP